MYDMLTGSVSWYMLIALEKNAVQLCRTKGVTIHQTINASRCECCDSDGVIVKIKYR